MSVRFELIQKALSLLPAARAQAFWSTHIRSDAALAAAAQASGFRQTLQRAAPGEVIHGCSRAEPLACAANPAAGGRSGCWTATGSSSARCWPRRRCIRPSRCTSARLNDAQVTHFLSIPTNSTCTRSR